MELDRDSLIALGRELVETVSTWATPDGVVEVKDSRVQNRAHAPTVHSLATHTLRSGTAAISFYEKGKELEAMPLIRSAWECSITAMWAADSRGGAAGIHEESRRQQGLLLKGMVGFPGVEPFDPAEQLARTFGDAIQTTVEANAQARRFEQRCLSLAGIGQRGYTIYRALSTFCHPSSALLDCYMEEDDGPAQVKLLHRPRDFDGVAWIYLDVQAMMWGARAFDVMTVDSPHRSYLRGVARRLQTGVDIARLTEAARAREEQAEKERRHAERKGRRRRER